jgi:probable FeS assembly SUF system protein SufT
VTAATITVRRACPATTVPFGLPDELSAGEHVVIVQTLGTSVTMRSERGVMLRVEAADADALGLTDQVPVRPDREGPFDLSDVWAVLDGIYDPEIPISVVELGLVYRCEEHVQPDGTRRIEIDMTMTAPGCGMGDVIRNDAIRAVSVLRGVDEVEVNLVWDPPWNVACISEAARLQLGLL